MQPVIDPGVEAVEMLSHAIKTLRDLRIVRSRRFTGDLGEWYVEKLYGVERAIVQTQKGWDIELPENGERWQVKTQTYDRQNRWNYLDSDPALFDRLILVIILDDFTIRDLYNVPVAELRPLLRIGTEKKLQYYWDSLEPWRVDPVALPGYPTLAKLITGRS